MSAMQTIRCLLLRSLRNLVLLGVACGSPFLVWGCFHVFYWYALVDVSDQWFSPKFHGSWGDSERYVVRQIIVTIPTLNGFGDGEFHVYTRYREGFDYRDIPAARIHEGDLTWPRKPQWMPQPESGSFLHTTSGQVVGGVWVEAIFFEVEGTVYSYIHAYTH